MPDLRHFGLEIPATSVSMAMMDTGSGSGRRSTPDAYIEAFGTGGGEAPPAATEGRSLGSGKRPAGSSVPRASRRRRDIGGTIIRMPALRTGNSEIPPDDGYTWRKYGQKDILGSRFPRSYYRCTHKSYYGCEAKKQVQRLDDDPYTYEIKYCGSHICQTSTTPLLMSPGPNNNNNHHHHPQGEPVLMLEATTQPPSAQPTSTQPAFWFPREFEHGQREIQSLLDPPGGHSSSTQAGSSNIQLGRDVDCPVADLADVMFNSGSSGSSMDAIFCQFTQNSRGHK